MSAVSRSFVFTYQLRIRKPRFLELFCSYFLHAYLRSTGVKFIGLVIKSRNIYIYLSADLKIYLHFILFSYHFVNTISWICYSKVCCCWFYKKIKLLQMCQFVYVSITFTLEIGTSLIKRKSVIFIYELSNCCKFVLFISITWFTSYIYVGNWNG